MEIVTWVLRGSLVHQDSTGHSGVIYPGLAQRMSAGRGILHSEKNDSWTLTGEQSHTEPVHFVQMWVVPDESGLEPGYQQLEIDDELLRGRLVTIASGMPEHSDQAAITIHNKYAALHGARMQAGDSIELPSAPYLHLFVPRGEVTLEGAGPLHEGDAVRFTASGGQRVTATEAAKYWSGRCMRVWLRHNRIGFCIAVTALLTACSTAPTPQTRAPAARSAAPTTTASATGLSSGNGAGRSGTGTGAIR